MSFCKDKKPPGDQRALMWTKECQKKERRYFDRSSPAYRPPRTDVTTEPKWWAGGFEADPDPPRSYFPWELDAAKALGRPPPKGVDKFPT